MDGYFVILILMLRQKRWLAGLVGNPNPGLLACLRFNLPDGTVLLVGGCRGNGVVLVYAWNLEKSTSKMGWSRLLEMEDGRAGTGRMLRYACSSKYRRR